MPPKPTWFHRLPKLPDLLRGMDSSHLDRQAVEELFSVGERRARQLMGMPPDGLKSPPNIHPSDASIVSNCTIR